MNINKIIIKFFQIFASIVVGFLFYNFIINFMDYIKTEFYNSFIFMFLICIIVSLIMNIALIIISKFIYGNEKDTLFGIPAFDIKYNFRKDLYFCLKEEYPVFIFYGLFTLISYILYFTEFREYAVILSPMFSFAQIIPKNIIWLAFILNLIFNCIVYISIVMLIRFIFFKKK